VTRTVEACSDTSGDPPGLTLPGGVVYVNFLHPERRT
jgi:hypothetical protein